MKYLAIVVWVACGLLHLASGQTACENATAALTASTTCFNALQSSNIDMVCGDACGSIFTAIKNNCDGAVSICYNYETKWACRYSYHSSRLCTGCL